MADALTIFFLLLYTVLFFWLYNKFAAWWWPTNSNQPQLHCEMQQYDIVARVMLGIAVGILMYLVGFVATAVLVSLFI